jgi:tetratricopeptide (TPR) repeat protein
MDSAAVTHTSLSRPRTACTQIVVSLGLACGSAQCSTKPCAKYASTSDRRRFRQVLSAPGDLDVGLRYARLLVQAGNFEGGVASMERLLLAPNPPASLRLELAILYYRLESYAVAESYLRAAIAAPSLPDVLLRQAEQILRDVAKRNQTNQFSGFRMLGVRGQTNPTARTDEDFIRAGGALGV